MNPIFEHIDKKAPMDGYYWDYSEFDAYLRGNGENYRDGDPFISIYTLQDDNLEVWVAKQVKHFDLANPQSIENLIAYLYEIFDEVYL